MVTGLANAFARSWLALNIWDSGAAQTRPRWRIRRGVYPPMYPRLRYCRGARADLSAPNTLRASWPVVARRQGWSNRAADLGNMFVGLDEPLGEVIILRSGAVSPSCSSRSPRARCTSSASPRIQMPPESPSRRARSHRFESTRRRQAPARSRCVRVDVRMARHRARRRPSTTPRRSERRTPPYVVYEVIPTTAFGFGTDESFSQTRWRF